MSSSEEAMGSASSHRKEKKEDIDQKKILLQRKVTTDLLEKLARSLPQIPNALAKTLKLKEEDIKDIEWRGNLHYLEKWKIGEKDDATIGNLIDLLKKSGFKDDVWECLFNISREPKNAMTGTESKDEHLFPRSSAQPTPTSAKDNAFQATGTENAYQGSMSNSTKQSSRQISQEPLLPDHKPLTGGLSSGQSGSSGAHSRARMSCHSRSFFRPGGHQTSSVDPQVLDTSLDDAQDFSTATIQIPGTVSQPESPKESSSLHATVAHIQYETGLGAAEARRISPARHKWLDFRDWGQVRLAWDFGAETPKHTVEIDDSNIGDYIPGIAVTNNGEIFLSDTKRKMLHKFSSTGRHVGTSNTDKLSPGGICVMSQDMIAVCGGNVVGLWNSEGHYMGEFGNGMFNWCRGICVDQSGRFIITDVESNSASIHAPDGQLICRLQAIGPNKFNKPYYVATNHRNQILVCDSRNHCIKIFDKDGKFLNKFGNFGTSSNQFRVPLGITLDCCGNLLINDYGNQRVSLFSSGGWFLHNVLTNSNNNIGQPIAMATTNNNQLLLSTVDSTTVSVYEFDSPGQTVRSPLDFPSY